jgi:hypothetical protein
MNSERRPMSDPEGLLTARCSTLTAEPAATAKTPLPIWSCSVWGLPCPLHCWSGGALLPHLFTLTPRIRRWARRFVFCGTFRRLALMPVSRTLSGTPLCGVRTFLPPHHGRGERPSGPAAYVAIIFDAYRPPGIGLTGEIIELQRHLPPRTRSPTKARGDSFVRLRVLCG